MADIVNLNKARKARAKAEAARQAAANRAKHGRSKAERAREAAEAAKREAALDGARKDPSEGP
jgi:hypothetical protein